MNLNRTIDFNSKFTRNSTILSGDMDGETIMLSIEKGQYYGLGIVGSRIWCLLDQPLSINDLCDILLKEYAVDPVACKQDVFEFINELFVKELIAAV